jgi:cell division septation protein DedD
MRALRGRLTVLGIVLGLAHPAWARDPLRPAELPPADFAGQQYVDSKGCMFVRAGTEAGTLWIPRVSRKGQPICGNPPSGIRVPVAEEIGVQAVPVPEEQAPKARETAPTAGETAARDAAVGGFFVAVGSFGIAANADKAEARLRAMSYGVVRGRLQGGSTSLITVFAGPFPDGETAAKARQELRGAGFPDAILIGP